MNFICYGEKFNKSILFIHGLASTADLCFKPLLPYLNDYYVIFCELDGHCDSCINDMISMEKTIEDIDEKIKAYKLKIYRLKQKRDEYYKLLKELENNSEIGY